MRHILPLLLLSGCAGENLTPPGAAEAAFALPCTPNLDGELDADELVPALGVAASYLVSPAGEERTVDLAGSVDASGHRRWDFTVPEVDPVSSVSADALGGRWYADSFPAGELVLPMDAAGALEAVYAHDDQALWLLGYALTAADPAAGRTLVVYASPVALYRFPLAAGASWRSIGEIPAGTLLGLPYVGRDVYDIVDEGTGWVDLPAMTFTQGHRLSIAISVEPNLGTPIVKRQASFVFECFGEVARFESRAGEPSPDFTVATGVRRLTW